MDDLARLVALAAELDAERLELARPYQRVERGRTEHVGGYASPKQAMAAGVAEVYRNRLEERGNLAHRVAGALRMNHTAPTFGHVSANMAQARHLITQHEDMAQHPGIKESFNRALGAIRDRNRPAFVAAHNDLERHVRWFTAMHAAA